MAAAAAMAVSLAVCVPSFGAEPGWVMEEDGWHYYLEDGSPAAGWVEKEGKSYYLPAGGSMLKDTVTPDGYYVDWDGAWYERAEKILDTEFKASSKVPNPGNEWAGKEALAGVKTKVSQRFSGKRSLRAGDNAVEFVKLEADAKTGTTGSTTTVGRITISSDRTSAASSDKSKESSAKETVLLGLYREPGQGRYRLDIRAALDGERAGAQAATWNYEIFRAMVYQVSSAPELLAEALYSAWEEENIWGIGREQWVRVGDCQVLYASGDGVGRFYMRPVKEGME